MSVVFLWRPLKSSVKKETWRVVVVLPWEDLLEKHEVSVVTDVPVSPSQVVTEFLCAWFVVGL